MPKTRRRSMAIPDGPTRICPFPLSLVCALCVSNSLFGQTARPGNQQVSQKDQNKNKPPGAPSVDSAGLDQRIFGEGVRALREAYQAAEKIQKKITTKRFLFDQKILNRSMNKIINSYEISPEKLSALMREGVEKNWPLEEDGDREMVIAYFKNVDTAKAVKTKANKQAENYRASQNPLIFQKGSVVTITVNGDEARIKPGTRDPRLLPRIHLF